MESVVVEKKEGESVDDSSIGAAADKDVITIAEDRERQARDLKAGLHPLKVLTSLIIISLFVSFD